MIDWLIYYRKPEANWPTWIQKLLNENYFNTKKFNNLHCVTEQCIIRKFGTANVMFSNAESNYIKIGYPYCKVSQHSFEDSSFPQELREWISAIDIDLESGTIRITRDNFGLVQLYIHNFSWGWAISTSLRLLLEDGSEVALERQYLNEYFFYDAWSGKNLPFRDIYQIPIGEEWRLETKGIQVIGNKWDMWFELLQQNHQQNLDVSNVLHKALKRTIRKLSYDKKYGIFLSGGFDSSLLAAICKEEGLPIVAFTCQVLDDEYDESQKAQTVASHLGLELHIVPFHKNDFLAGLVDAIARTGIPLAIPNQVGLAIVAKQAAFYGIDVMLCGEGADELFQGYPRLLSLRDQLTYQGQNSQPSVMNWELAREQFLIRSFDDLVRLGFGIPERMKLMTILREVFFNITEPIEQELRIAWLMEFFVTLCHNLFRLRDAVRCADMDLVLPYLSQEVAMVGLTNIPKLSTLTITKPFIRQLAMSMLPKEILNQPKQGFGIPVDSWLPFIDNSFGEGIELLWGLSKEQIQIWAKHQPISGDLRWALLNLDIWSRLFFLEESQEKLQTLILGT